MRFQRWQIPTLFLYSCVGFGVTYSHVIEQRNPKRIWLVINEHTHTHIHEAAQNGVNMHRSAEVCTPTHMYYGSLCHSHCCGDISKLHGSRAWEPVGESVRCGSLEWLQTNTGLNTARGISTKSHGEIRDFRFDGDVLHICIKGMQIFSTFLNQTQF